jgi:glycosyltransferase involved in cell wall biosynthesis
MKYKVSVITVNYNNSDSLIRTIESVITQTYELFEYIIIDGGSNDGSKEIIEKYAHKIDYWVSEPDAGIYDAMNKGIKYSKGEYLLFLNSGDELIENPNIVLQSLEYLNGEDIVAFNCLLVQKNRVVGQRKHPLNPSLYYVYKFGLKHQSTFIRKDLFDKLGLYNTNYPIAADYEFWLRVLLHENIKIKGVDITLSKYELGGISHNNWQADYVKIHQQIPAHILVDFQKMDTLMIYDNSTLFRWLAIIKKNIYKVKSAFIRFLLFEKRG